MEDSETELAVSESDALGADFITVELDTQPIEYVVKWAEVGSKFTISCVKKDSDDPSDLTPDQLKIETDEAFFAPYEEVYPCEVTEQSVEIKTDSDEDEEDEEEEEDTEEEQDVLVEAGSSQLDGEVDSDQADFEPEERQYRCSYCGKCYSHASSLYRHQQTHTGKSAGAPAPTKRALEPTHQEARYTCPHCGLSFKGSRSVLTVVLYIIYYCIIKKTTFWLKRPGTEGAGFKARTVSDCSNTDAVAASLIKQGSAGVSMSGHLLFINVGKKS